MKKASTWQKKFISPVKKQLWDFISWREKNRLIAKRRLMNDKRKYPRVNTKVLASLDCYDEDGELSDQKLGVILDISLGGMLIETDDTIKANYVEIVFINHEHNLMSIVGSIVHSRKSENGKAKTGFCFHGADTENVKIATNLIRAHFYGNKDPSSRQSKIKDL